MNPLLVTLTAALLASACTVRTNQYYLPTDSRLAQEGTVCGSVPFGHANIPLGDTLRAFVSASPSAQNISLTIQLPLPLGARVRFVKPELSIEPPGTGRVHTGQLEPFRVSVYGEGSRPGHHDLTSPSSLLEGKGRNLRLATADTQYLKSDLYISRAVIAAEPSESVTLIFPAVEVNGAVIEAQRIPLRLVTKSGVLACVQ